ncbi:MAG: heat shock protein transcriptional repressor HspR [Mycobacteriales bacterium]
MTDTTAAADRPVYVISVAAELSGMHPQTLRTYDRLGLVSPGRTSGRGRRYSERDVALLREVQRLSQEEGVSLPGIRRILALEAEVTTLRQQVAALAAALERSQATVAEAVRQAHASHRRELVPVRAGSGSVVVWRHGAPHRTS